MFEIYLGWNGMGLYIRKIKWFFIPAQSELKTEIISDLRQRRKVLSLMRPEWALALGWTFKEKAGAV